MTDLGVIAQLVLILAILMLSLPHSSIASSSNEKIISLYSLFHFWFHIIFL